MSSREDAKNWLKFCKLLREGVIDEKKASTKDYPEMKRVFKKLPVEPDVAEFFEDDIEGIISDESRHYERLKSFFDTYCPRMAIHRKGVEEMHQGVILGGHKIHRRLGGNGVMDAEAHEQARRQRIRDRQRRW